MASPTFFFCANVTGPQEELTQATTGIREIYVMTAVVNKVGGKFLVNLSVTRKTDQEDVTIEVKVHSFREKILSGRLAPNSRSLSFPSFRQDEVMLYASV